MQADSHAVHGLLMNPAAAGGPARSGARFGHDAHNVLVPAAYPSTGSEDARGLPWKFSRISNC